MDFARREILVRQGKGGKERRTMLAAGLEAARRAGLAKRATCHTLRHPFATHLLESGDIWGQSKNARIFTLTPNVR